MAQTLRAPCKKRTLKRCSVAPKSCKYTSGIKRKYCRKARNTMKKYPKKSVTELYKAAYKSKNIFEDINPMILKK
jgi:hypothetical protein